MLSASAALDTIASAVTPAQAGAQLLFIATPPLGSSEFFHVIMAKPYDAVIFDLDGTLMDTAGEIATALERTFRELGFPTIPKHVVETLIGRGVPMLIERALLKVGATHE